MEQRLILVTLGVGDVAVARGFYETMGWEVGWSDGDVAFFQAGGMVVALWDRAKLAADSAVEDPGGWGGVTLAQVVGTRDEVDAIAAQAQAAGGTRGREPGETSWGGYSTVVVDPDGHPWEVAVNPGWTLHGDGTVTLS